MCACNCLHKNVCSSGPIYVIVCWASYGYSGQKGVHAPVYSGQKSVHATQAKKCFRSCDGNSGFSHNLIFVEVSEWDDILWFIIFSVCKQFG